MLLGKGIKRRSFVSLFRIGHWTKNLLIFTPLVFSGNITKENLLIRVFYAFVLFSLLASSVYVLNDVLDVKQDRMHKRKKERPIASGVVSIGFALTCHILLLSVSLYGALTILGFKIFLLFLVYYFGNIFYSLSIKTVPPLDIIVVSVFYLIRAVIGSVAIGVTASSWLLLTIFFGALYLVSIKRLSELTAIGIDGINTRVNIDDYTIPSLKKIGQITLTLTLGIYTIYAISFPHYFALTVVPLAVIWMRLIMIQDSKLELCEEPEKLLFKDKISLMFFFLWVLMVIIYHWK